MATAVFDYDTKDLDYYIDDYGVKIYYKKDGTTPVPNPENNSRNVNITIYHDDESYVESYDGYYDENYNGYYNRYGEYIQTTAPNAEIIEETSTPVTVPSNLLENNENSYILYNKDTNEWVEVQNDFKIYGGDYTAKEVHMD